MDKSNDISERAIYIWNIQGMFQFTSEIYRVCSNSLPVLEGLKKIMYYQSSNKVDFTGERNFTLFFSFFFFTNMLLDGEFSRSNYQLQITGTQTFENSACKLMAFTGIPKAYCASQIVKSESVVTI